MASYIEPLSIVCGPMDVANPSTGGFQIACFKAKRALSVVTAYTEARVAVGAGTISVVAINYGTAGTVAAGTIFSHGTATAWTAQVPATETIVTGTVTTGQWVKLLVKGDGTLDLTNFVAQFDVVYGSPAAAG